MPAITLDKAAITNLKTYKIASTLDYAYLALKYEKDPANSTQNIDTDQFQMDWGVTNTDLLRYLQQLETKKVLKVTPTSLSIIWGDTAEATTISQSEVLSMKKEGLINTTSYVYYALLLNKTANNATQAVNPATYAANPWTIDGSTLLQELGNISQKTNSDKSKVITLDLTTISVVWLI
ncbi:MAG: hypothetical protein KME46_33805 [Brasilonema angustatum HA4187-MV1]|jgi:hypothetical protein|nr:hypothetical protein [Brasilonema angustatum HA4187-MV1]